MNSIKHDGLYCSHEFITVNYSGDTVCVNCHAVLHESKGAIPIPIQVAEAFSTPGVLVGDFVSPNPASVTGKPNKTTGSAD